MPSIPSVKVCLPHEVQNSPDGLSLQGLYKVATAYTSVMNQLMHIHKYVQSHIIILQQRVSVIPVTINSPCRHGNNPVADGSCAGGHVGPGLSAPFAGADRGQNVG